MNILVSEDVRAVCPEFVGAALEARITNTPYSASLWEEIKAFQADCRRRHTTESVKGMPPIQATRSVYKRCGKDPSRYRPSAEALLRRMLKGSDLYRIDTAVDLINLASVAYGYSIGGFDAGKIVGDTIVLGIGREGEAYEGIGRGPLNIAGMPVYRDGRGGIGTPTSDHERTKLGLSTTRLLAVVNGYDGNREGVLACATYMRELLKKHAGSDGGDITLF